MPTVEYEPDSGIDAVTFWISSEEVRIEPGSHYSTADESEINRLDEIDPIKRV